MKLDESQPRLPYTTTPTLPVETPPQFVPADQEALREVDARIVHNIFAVYARRYGREQARELIRALTEKYVAS